MYWPVKFNEPEMPVLPLPSRPLRANSDHCIVLMTGESPPPNTTCVAMYDEPPNVTMEPSL